MSRMRDLRLVSAASGLLLVVAMILLIAGCGGSGKGDTPAAGGTKKVSKTTTTLATATASTVPAVVDELSTFKSKDPFKQQALPATSTTSPTGGSSTTGGTGTTSTTGGTGSTTTTGGTGSTTTTTGGSGSTTTTNPSNVTTPLHSLKVLSIDEANGQAVVTFEVDGVIYEDKRVGDVVSTSWGQIEVMSVNAQAQTVTLLHGSETRSLSVGEEFLK